MNGISGSTTADHPAHEASSTTDESSSSAGAPHTLTVSVPGKALLAEYERQGATPERVRFVHWDFTGPAPLDHIDLVVPPYMGATDKLGLLGSVRTRLVQSQSIGFDGVDRVLPPGHRYANAATVHESSTAELALALMLASQRQLPDMVRAQDAGRWSPKRSASLADRRVLIIGFGGVGQAIAARLAPFEVTVTAVARSAKTVSVSGEALAVQPMTQLDTLLPEADIVVLAVPLSEDTRGLVDAAFLAKMVPDALLVNVARGPVVNTDALLEALESRRIRAAVDVCDPEPLPAEHPLWRAQGVLISPHVGGASSAMMPRMARLLRRQIELLLAGREPENVVLRS